MGWGFLDDHWDEHPKVLAAYEMEPLAPLLFVSGVLYCRRSGQPGVIPAAKVRSLLGYRPKARKALLAAELWHDAMGVVEIHDWDQWNRKAAARTASARNAAAVRWANDRAERQGANGNAIA